MHLEPTLLRNIFVVVIVCATVAVGCRRTVDTQTAEMEFPTELTSEGQTWVKQPWEQRHDKRVASVFKKHTYLASNPTLEGQRVVYADEKGNERCYWITPSQGGAQWLYIEFNGNRSRDPVEGVGAPF